MNSHRLLHLAAGAIIAWNLLHWHLGPKAHPWLPMAPEAVMGAVVTAGVAKEMYDIARCKGGPGCETFGKHLSDIGGTALGGALVVSLHFTFGGPKR